MGGGSKTSTSTSEPWKPTQDALKNIMSQAENLFNAQGGINKEWLDKELADLNPEMRATIEEMVSAPGFKDVINNVQGASQEGMAGIGGATGALGEFASGQRDITSDQINKMAKDLYQSELVQGQKAQLAEDVQKSLAGQIKDLNQSAAASGNMGSSRAGVAQGVATGEAAKAIAQGSAAIENSAIQNAVAQAMNTLQTNQNAQMGSSQALGNLGIQSAGIYGNTSSIYNTMLQNQLNASGILQDYQQSVLDNKWYNAQGAENAGWNNLFNYLNTVGSIGAMGGQTSQSGGGGNGAFGTILGTAGAVVGGIYGGGPAGATAGYAIGSGVGNSVSDRRFKDDIELVQEASVGHDAEGNELPIPAIYRWKWNDKALALFEKEGFTAIPFEGGVIAQELEELGLGEFVVEVPFEIEGFDTPAKIVNYDALFNYVKLAGAMKEGEA